MSIRVSMGVSILEWLGGQHTDYMEPLLSEKWKDIEKYFPLCWKNIIDKLYPFDGIHFQKQKENIGTSHNSFIHSMSCYKKLIAYQDNLNHSWQEQYEKKS